MRIIKKAVFYIFKALSFPFMFVGMTLAIIGSFVLRGYSETEERLDDLNKTLKYLHEKYTIVDVIVIGIALWFMYVMSLPSF